VRAYPNVLVPPIKKCKQQKQFASKYINKRESLLARFLRNVLRNRILRGDNFLMSFLSESDEKQFKTAQTAMAKFERVTKLTDLVTYEGAIELSEN
jgi:hypothetical protein